jgi:hypothetical protein
MESLRVSKRYSSTDVLNCRDADSNPEPDQVGLRLVTLAGSGFVFETDSDSRCFFFHLLSTALTLRLFKNGEKWC